MAMIDRRYPQKFIGKIIGRIIAICCAFFMVNLGRDMAKSSAVLFCFILDSNFSIWLWERPKTHDFYDFGISGRVHDSPNQSF